MEHLALLMLERAGKQSASRETASSKLASMYCQQAVPMNGPPTPLQAKQSQ
jgi:hypothetical protein